MPEKKTAQKTGNKGEELAAAWLVSKGFEIVARNFRVREGEIDLIARRGEELHFVEVKARSSDFGGEPEGWVDANKQAKIIKAAQSYLAENEGEPCFDVVAIRFEGGQAELKLIEDAFEAF